MVMAVVLSPSLGAAAPASRAAEAVARSLCALVRATVEGVVREAVIVGSVEDELAEIADHAGCGLIETRTAAEGLARAAAQSRSQIAFVLKGGSFPRAASSRRRATFCSTAPPFAARCFGARPTA